MASILEQGTLFPEELVTELVNAVKGTSSLSLLCGAEPVRFNGQREFTFTMDKEVDIVAESGAKSNGGITITPRTIVPIKFEYGARVTDEFMSASEDDQIDILSGVSDGFGRKLAKGFDIAAMHGINPRTGNTSTVIGDNYFDGLITNVVAADDSSTADEQVEDAIGLVQATENDVTGIIMAPALRTSLSKLTDGNGSKLYPELAWGNAPSTINGLPASVNPTVAANDNADLAIVGDFAGAFRWGYAKDVTMEIIQYGNPDNDTTLGDLKGHNQIYIRLEAYIGWGILLPDAFAIVRTSTPSPDSVKTTSAKASK